MLFGYVRHKDFVTFGFEIALVANHDGFLFTINCISKKKKKKRLVFLLYYRSVISNVINVEIMAKAIY